MTAKEFLAFMDDHKLTVAIVAHRIGMSPRTVSVWRNRDVPEKHLDKVLALAKPGASFGKCDCDGETPAVTILPVVFHLEYPNGARPQIASQMPLCARCLELERMQAA